MQPNQHEHSPRVSCCTMPAGQRATMTPPTITLPTRLQCSSVTVLDTRCQGLPPYMLPTPSQTQSLGRNSHATACFHGQHDTPPPSTWLGTTGKFRISPMDKGSPSQVLVRQLLRVPADWPFLLHNLQATPACGTKRHRLACAGNNQPQTP